jgi:hypothetical protein
VVREAVVFLMMPVIRIVSFAFFDGMISTSLEDVEVRTMVPAVVVSVMVMMMMTKEPVTEMTSVVVVVVAMGICASFDYFNILNFAKKINWFIVINFQKMIEKNVHLSLILLLIGG